MILNAGLATIQVLEKEFDGMIQRTETLKKGIQEIFSRHGIKVLTPGLGSMFNIVVTDLNEIQTYRDLQQSDFNLRKKIDYALLLEGIYNKPCNRYNMSVADNDEVIAFTLDAFEKAFNRI